VRSGRRDVFSVSKPTAGRVAVEQVVDLMGSKMGEA